MPVRLRNAALAGPTFCLWLSVAVAADPAPPSAEPPDWFSPAIALVRDPEVQAELKLTPDEQRGVEDAINGIDVELWRLRDTKVDESGPQILEKLATARERILSALTREQSHRFAQLLLRAPGTSVFAQPSVIKELKLTLSQQKKVSTAVKATTEAKEKLRAQPGDHNQEVLDLLKQQDTQLEKLLTPRQSKKFTELVGPPFSFSTVRKTACRAPDLSGIEAWINSAPLELGQLRGKVVVIHFWSFGCINCMHNLPHYQSWQERFHDKDFVMIGVHTPETPEEHKLDEVKAKVKEYNIAYPVAVDAKAETWKAYANDIWPAVYVIDKRGYVRYWWYGELNWKEAEGEKRVRGYIDQLLAEKD